MTEFFPEQTIHYKTYVKNTMVDALGQVFQNHVDPMLKDTKTSVEYPKTEADYKAVVVRFFERDITNAGVGHYEYLRVDGETAPSDDTVVTSPGNSSVHLSWDSVPDAFRYHVYRLAPTGETKFFITNDSAFTDTGTKGTNGKPPTFATTGAETPNVNAVTLGPGSLPPGAFHYKVTALTPGEVWKFKHYFYSADIEFAIYALSSYDRDLISDSIVQTITMGQLESYTNRFFSRVYPDPESDQFVAGDLHFINLNTDRIQGFGETQQPAPWGSEDELVYMTSYRVGVFGEFYNLPPNVPFSVVKKVLDYPYIGGVEPVPTGTPNDDSEWLP